MKDDRPNECLTNVEREELRHAVEREGAYSLARCIGVHHEPLARAVAGFRTRRGTIALIRSHLIARREAAR